ncbi:Pyruvate dehydrogenase E1 component subunit beta-3, chloroplastic [Glycine soja]
MATLFQGLGVVNPSLASSNSNKFHLPSRTSLSERKDGIFVVRSDATRVSSQVLKAGARKHELLVTNAVATKEGRPAASTSKSGQAPKPDSPVSSLRQAPKPVCGLQPLDELLMATFILVETTCTAFHSDKTVSALWIIPILVSSLLFQMHELLLFEALREGLEEEMERDPCVCVMGEDVGHYGGSYKVTKGLATKFGDLRVLDTPIAENSFTGMGIGAAMTGLRPVVEGMNMGFLLLAFNQISNNCGMLHYTSGGQFKIPIVIRGPGGVGRQLGAEHSQRLESYFQSIPGIQMVACSTPYNAKGLMKAAIRSENPVILFEHVLLYNLKERIPDEEYVLSLEEAEMVRPGEHVTILTYSRMRYHVMQAAKTLVNKGYDPEVIDIRSLKPFDLHTIGNSVKKTHRVLIVEECMRTGGIGASLTAAITENFHDYLDAPIVCLSSQDVPTPYAGTLEEWTVVQPAQIVTAVEQLCK